MLCLRFPPLPLFFVQGKWSTLFHGECVDGDVLNRITSPGRKTLSVSRARQRETGVRGVLARLDIKSANTLHRLMAERFVLLAKQRALEDRHRNEPSQTTDNTDDIAKISLALKDSLMEIRATAKEHTPTLLAVFSDPHVSAAMNLAQSTEEEAFDSAYEVFGSVETAREKARLWRHTVGSVGHRVSAESKYRYTTHNSPNHKGDRALSNILGSRTEEENLSYYETQTLRHGRARRGSTSIHGVWKSVWDEAGNFIENSEPVPTIVGMGLGGNGSVYGGSAASVGSFRDRSPSASRRQEVVGGGGGGSGAAATSLNQQVYGSEELGGAYSGVTARLAAAQAAAALLGEGISLSAAAAKPSAAQLASAALSAADAFTAQHRGF